MHREGDSLEAVHGAVPAAEIEAQLQLIFSSAQFHKSERMCGFLRFVVEQSMQGAQEGPKEYAIGVEVFGKDSSFDPRTDSNVRTEARRLRAKLAEYYATTGQFDSLRIELPKGGYTPVFIRPAPPATEPFSIEPVSPPASKSRVILVAAAVMVLSGVAAATVWRRFAPASPSARPRSVAVLPFLNLSSGEVNDDFTDGLTEEILNHLTRVPGLKVVARTSSFQFKGKSGDIRTIGKRLNVDAVLEGSVRRIGKRVRITPQLIATADGYHIWSETLERDVDDLFALQDEISRLVVKALGGTASAPAAQQSRSPEAYRLYLRARYHFNRWTIEDFRASIALYEETIARDHDYAPAYAGLSAAHGLLAAWGEAPRAEASAKSRAAARKAIALDSNLGEAYEMLACGKAVWDHDWEGAGKDFQRALSLSPGAADVHDEYAIHYLAPQMRLEEALREARKAFELDPLSLRIATDLGAIHYFRRDHDAAIAQFRQALALEPRFGNASMQLFKCFLMQRRFAEARRIIDPPAQSPYPDEFALHMGRLDALSGNRIEARKLLTRLLRDCRLHCAVSPVQLAWLQIAVADLDGAFQSLERAYTERNFGLLMLQTDPVFDPLRADPRYRALLAKMHLAR